MSSSDYLHGSITKKHLRKANAGFAAGNPGPKQAPPTKNGPCPKKPTTEPNGGCPPMTTEPKGTCRTTEPKGTCRLTEPKIKCP